MTTTVPGQEDRTAAYREFLERRTQLDGMAGFEPLWLPDFLFGFQQLMTGWAIRQGRGALLADCGLGKGPMALTWAQNVHLHTGRPVLLLTPLGVTSQMRDEAAKFGIEAAVRQMYDRLWNEPPPQDTAYQRKAVRAALALAAREGWAPPLAWDDDSIDNPAAVAADWKRSSSTQWRAADLAAEAGGPGEARLHQGPRGRAARGDQERAGSGHHADAEGGMKPGDRIRVTGRNHPWKGATGRISRRVPPGPLELPDWYLVLDPPHGFASYRRESAARGADLEPEDRQGQRGQLELFGAGRDGPYCHLKLPSPGAGNHRDPEGAPQGSGHEPKELHCT